MNSLLSSLDVLAHLTDAVIAIDLEGRVLFWNQGAEKLYGWTSREALGQAANGLLKTRFVPPADSARTLEALVDSLLRDGSWQGELTRCSRAGEPIDVLSRWAILRDSAGASIGRLIIDTDLTETRLRFHELRLAEERAREYAEQASSREALLACLIDGISDYAFMKDRDGRYIAINPATAGFFGKEVSEVIGKSDFELFPQAIAQRLVEEDREVFASGGSLGFEQELPGAGGPNQVHTIKTVCRDRAGLVIGLVGISRDMRERRQLLDALRERERDLMEAHRIAGIGTWRWLRATDTVTWSDEIYRIYGVDKTHRPLSYAEMRDKKDAPPTQKLFVQAFERAEKFGEPFAMDVEITPPDGSTRWIVVRGEVETWEKGQVASLRGTVHEITERKRYEQQLALSENRYRSLVHASAQIVWVASWDGQQLGNSPEWQAFTGQTAEEASGFGWANAIHPGDREEILELWQEAVRTGTPLEFRKRLRRHDGAYRTMAVRAVPVRDETGSIVEWVGSCTDIHDQKLAQEALRRSEKLAATGRLAASIAHEINNPLEAVTNSLYLALRDPALAADTRNFLQVAEQELSRVAQITTQTLRFHKQSKSSSNADLCDIMESVLMLFGPRLQARHILIQREFEAGATIQCFEDELRQVFANLVSNSLDATADGGCLRVRIRKTIAAATDRAPGVRVTVADTGSGISKEMRKSIFEPFVSTKSDTGLGLGLWVSAGIIRKHQARLLLHSSDDPRLHGTVMSLFFPASGIRPQMPDVTG